MASEKIHLRLVTKYGQIVDGTVDEIVLPGLWGEMGILPEHEPFFTKLNVGQISYRDGASTSRLAVSGGYAMIKEESEVLIIAFAMEKPDEIDIERAKQAKLRAEERIRVLEFGDSEYLKAEMALRKALNRLDAAEKK